MGKRQLRRGEKHHWWPQALSKFWADDKGLIHRLDTKGNVTKSTPRKLGRISDAHNFYMDEASSWDQTFEHLFDRPDRNLPKIVTWLFELTEKHKLQSNDLELHSYFPHHCDGSMLQKLSECLISLAVRSPKFRAGIAGFVQSLRNEVNKTELRQLIAINLQQSYQQLIKSHKGDGKFLVIFSNSREFIFGDGFYHNLSGSSQHAVFSRVLAPLTPELAVLYTCPMQYNPNPPLFSILANPELVDLVNESVQVHSKDCLFFRSQMPLLSEHFVSQGHFVYSTGDPVEELIASIPGVGFGARSPLF